jgi:dTDP-glucose 4,6-dehydratase
MDIAKIRRELSWQPQESFDSGLRKTVAWYLANRWWWEPIWSHRYRGERLGIGADRVPEEAPPTASSAD